MGGEGCNVCNSETSLWFVFGSVGGPAAPSLAWIAAGLRSGCEAKRANQDVSGQWKERENRNYEQRGLPLRC